MQTFPNSSVFVITIFIFLLTSDVQSDFSFQFPSSNPKDANKIGFANDATLSSDSNSIKLTSEDQNGYAVQHSVGQSGLIKPIRLYDKNRGKVADFTTEFSFVIDRQGRKDHGDGMAFFFISPDFSFPDSQTSGGGFLGLFTSIDKPSEKPIVAVEFDTFANDWDPFPDSQTPHLGIDVGSIKSVTTALWFVDIKPQGTVINGRISYEANTQNLSVSVRYGDGGPALLNADLSYIIDLTSVLPEQVQIGFSAATGALVETHQVLTWSVTTNL